MALGDIDFNEDDVVVDTDADLPEFPDETSEETKEEETEETKEDEQEEVEEEKSEEENEEETEDEKDTKKSKKDKEEEEDEDPFKDHKYTRPKYKDIVAKYPRLFKEFPELSKAFFRERDFTKLFPTLSDAQDAANKAQMYDVSAQALLSGDAKDFIDLMKRSKNDDVLQSFTSTFLPAIYEADKEGFQEHFVTPIISRLVTVMKTNGKKFDNDAMVDAAKVVAKFIFNSEEEPEVKPKKIEKKEDDEQNNFWARRGAEFQQDVQFRGYTQAHELVLSTIKPHIKEAGLNEKKANLLSREMFEDIDAILGKDERYQSQIASLWKSARGKGFNGEIGNRIINLYMSKVKAVLPGIKARHFKELGIKSSTKTGAEDTNVTRPTGSNTPSSAGSKASAKDIDWSKTSDADYMAGKITYKK